MIKQLIIFLLLSITSVSAIQVMTDQEYKQGNDYQVDIYTDLNDISIDLLLLNNGELILEEKNISKYNGVYSTNIKIPNNLNSNYVDLNLNILGHSINKTHTQQIPIIKKTKIERFFDMITKNIFGNIFTNILEKFK